MKNYQYTDNLTSERIYTKFLTIDENEVFSEFFESDEATKFFPKFELKTTKWLVLFLIQKK